MNPTSIAGYAFDRPVIIVAAPRSGSTLLFETMARASTLWTIGDESHMVFEGIDKLNPQNGKCASNRLNADDADDATIEQIRNMFFQRLRNSAGESPGASVTGSAPRPRLLEKTPKNSLRIPFLERVFPDALYIYLYRDPRENLSSMIEAWRSSDFVTYADLPGWPGNWSMLLPPGFDALRGKPLEEIVAYQWQAANQHIINDLGQLAENRWTAVSYAEIVHNAPATLERLCAFADIPFDDELLRHCASALPLSRYTSTAPRPGKWRVNEAMIERVMDGLQDTIEQVAEAVAPHTSSPVLLPGGGPESGDTGAELRGRNSKCLCGSGLRFKHCHGILSSADDNTYGTGS